DLRGERSTQAPRVRLERLPPRDDRSRVPVAYSLVHDSSQNFHRVSLPARATGPASSGSADKHPHSVESSPNPSSQACPGRAGRTATNGDLEPSSIPTTVMLHRSHTTLAPCVDTRRG